MKICSECKNECQNSICIRCNRIVCSNCITEHIKKHNRILADLIIKGQLTKKESRSIFEYVLIHAHLSKMNKTLLLTELIGRNEEGEFS